MLKLNDGVAVEPMENEGGTEAVVINTRTGQYLWLNHSAHEMLNALSECMEEDDAVSRLVDHFDTDRDTLITDLNAFRGQLYDLGLAIP